MTSRSSKPTAGSAATPTLTSSCRPPDRRSVSTPASSSTTSAPIRCSPGLFTELEVATQASEMSMSVRCAGCGLQYAGQRGLGGVAAGLRRGRGRYLRMLTEVPRFHRAARRLLAGDACDDRTFCSVPRGRRLFRFFTAHFALPLVAAVWSCPPGTALSYPARYLCAFLADHGMLSVSGSPPWRTVTGGSRCYVERATKRLHDIRLARPCAPCAANRTSRGDTPPPGADAGARARARVRVQPADRLLVPPGRRHAGLRGAEVHNTYGQRHAYLLHPMIAADRCRSSTSRPTTRSTAATG